MLIEFKKDQIAKHLSHLNNLKSIYESGKLNVAGDVDYSLDLLNSSVNVLDKIKLIPDQLEVEQYKNKPCVTFVYNVYYQISAHIKLQPNSYFSYYICPDSDFKTDGTESSNKTLKPEYWIDFTTKELLDKKMKEYNC